MKIALLSIVFMSILSAEDAAKVPVTKTPPPPTPAQVKALGERIQKSKEQVEELRRLLYVGMTRTIDRLVLTCAETRNGDECGGHKLLDELDLTPTMMS